MARQTLQRIVSLEPSVTAILYALGQQDRLVAVSKYCERLVDVGNKPQLAPTWSADAQAITALNPDLVIASVPYRVESITALLQARVNVLALYPNRLEDLFAHIVYLGRLCDVSDRAEKLVTELKSEFEALRAHRARRPRVYYEVWSHPLISAPGWVADLIELVGGQVVPSTWNKELSEQDVIDADPEIIVLAWPGVSEQRPELVRQRPGWQNVSAVKYNRIMPVDEILLNAPGPNLLQGAQQLAAIIQSDL